MSYVARGSRCCIEISYVLLDVVLGTRHFDTTATIMWQFENITSRIYFPILWFSETAEAGEDITAQLKLVLNTIPLIANVFSFFMVSVGGFLILSAFVLAILFALGKSEPSYTAVSSDK
ncbi:hypothetical protein AVEN_120699-1 [Araneus ventricosus]|uniref:Uncharacterized protein n=1 Tax=Araneus ventricosus TaxID=182803 RepID=A0A4Y2UID8_ARAVE|nr:hypothetical protein AVEN_247350-1 [Araneus ventricosus]GBO11317.1 hypothetical protein AVEN_120699-1 [Araneus ventricosus]